MAPAGGIRAPPGIFSSNKFNNTGQVAIAACTVGRMQDSIHSMALNRNEQFLH